MSPRFYAALWIVFFAAALVCFVAGVFTMLTAVVFGFTAFGLIFAGMMCVLPAQVSHSHEHLPKPEKIEKPVKAKKEEKQVSGIAVPRPV